MLTAKKLKKQFTTWDEVNNQVLREYLYQNGFTITTVNEKTGKVKKDKYVVYKRSSAKSRTGQCLFIKEKLYKSMINWSRMGLPFVEGMNVDYAGLLAYESLVGSSLEGTVEIGPQNILIISDMESKFKHKCNVVKKDDNIGRLGSFEGQYEVSNNLFDGESLLSSEFFEEGQSMLLLRNHMFKSASFNCNIQQYLQDKCPEGIEFDNWQIKNMFGQDMFAKDVKMVCTPTSLKALKFDKDLMMTKEQIWEHWKQVVTNEGCIFGICKHEKESKRGRNDSGDILQQTSYQMINSMPLSLDDLDDLTEFERDFTMRLKNDNDFFINYIIQNANNMNSNLMFAELAQRNKDFTNTELFRDFRRGEVNKHVTHCKKGKIRLNGDYCVLLGNPMEYLAHAIGMFDIDKVDADQLSLKGNEIYTTLHEDGADLVCFRNPHTSPSNVLVAENKYVDDIKTYFNLSQNIVCVNAIKFPIQDILSGCDYDSDSMVIFNDRKLLEVGKKCFGKFNVCINSVDSDKKQYRLTTKDMHVIDSQLANSQRNIGEVVNLGQLCMSTYWDLLNNGSTEEELKGLMDNVSIMTILSGICIDLAKKFYDIDIEAEIGHIAESEELRSQKPLFWKYISQSKTIKNRVVQYNCPMDYLNLKMGGLSNAKHRENIDLVTLLVKQNVRGADRNQESKIVNYVEEMCTKINSINASCNNDDETEAEEKDNIIEDIIKYYDFYMQKLTVKKDTMYSILNHMIKQNRTNIQTKLLNILFDTQREVFLETFKLI